MRPALSDTDSATAAVHLALLRAATPGRRLGLAFSLSRSIVALARDGLARQLPGASDEDIGLAFVAGSYGQALADEVRAALVRRRR